jgi:hypothetical protein
MTAVGNNGISRFGADVMAKTEVSLRTGEGARHFESIKQAAKHFRVDSSVVVQRLFRGWSIEQALGLTDPPPRLPSNQREVSVTHEGKKLSFGSIKAAARHFRLNQAMLSKRLLRGWNLRQALGLAAPPPRTSAKARPVEVIHRGRKRCFAALSHASKAFDVDDKLVSNRLKQGWSLEEALGLQRRPARSSLQGKPVTVSFGGKAQTYASVSQAARAHGLPPRVVLSRVQRLGWSLEQSLGLADPPEKKLPSNAKRVEVLHNGQRLRFRSITEAAKAFGLSRAIVHKRWKVFGWPLAEALEIVPHDRNFVGRSQPVAFTHNGKRYTYKSISEAAEAHGITPGTVLSRLERWGGNIRQALGLIAPPAHKKSCYGFIYLITHRTSGRRYVGQTLLPIQRRWEEHVRSSENANPSGPHLRCAIRKNGKRQFTIEELDQTSSFHDANVKERKWIETLGTLHPAGFNMTKGGGGINLGRPIVVKSVRYPSIADAARAYNLSALKVASRLREFGWSTDQAFGLQPPPPRDGAPQVITLTIDGRCHKYPSIKAAAHELNKDYGLVRSRIKACGWSVQQAFDLEPPPVREATKLRRVEFILNGQQFRYASVKEAAAAHGVPRPIVDARLNRLGWSFAQALGVAPPPTVKPNNSKKVRFSHEGTWYRYSSVKAAAKAHGLKASTVAARIRSGKFTWAQALDLASAPLHDRRPDCAIEFLHEGRKYRYRSIGHAAQVHGLKAGTVTARIRSGYTVQQAVGLAPPPKRGRWATE